MPFIKPERRKIIDEEGLRALDDICPGDLCYYYYKNMVTKWKENPRWDTAHEIYRNLIVSDNISNLSNLDDIVASDLAWQVFFMKYIWPYELLKIQENGDI